MATFILKRVAQSIPVLFGISILLFFMMHAVPGGPLAMYAHDPGVTKQLLHQLAQNYGLNQPLWVQYWDWLAGAVRGNFGYSYMYGLPATQMVFERLPATLELMGTAFIIAVALSFVIGVTTAVRQYSVWDYVMTALSYFGVAMPTFWLGLMVLILFAVYLHWFPAGGMATPGVPASFGNQVWHMVLPASVLAAYLLAHESRYVRSSMLEVLHMDYVRTARAKGLREQRVIWAHAVRNALLPVLTIMVMDGAYLFGGALVTETIFSWPGMGRLFMQAVSQGDYPVLMMEISFLSVVIVAANIVADVLYAYLDPRISY